MNMRRVQTNITRSTAVSPVMTGMQQRKPVRRNVPQVINMMKTTARAQAIFIAIPAPAAGSIRIVRRCCTQTMRKFLRLTVLLLPEQPTYARGKGLPRTAGIIFQKHMERLSTVIISIIVCMSVKTKM